MGEIVNLNRVRKEKARADGKAAAAANRAAHGRTRGQRDAAEAERLSAARFLDGAKLDAPPGIEPEG